MSTPKHLQSAQAITESLFGQMKDVANQGARFRWATFPDFCARMVDSSLFLGYAQTPKNFEALKQEAVVYAKALAEELVKANAGTLEQRCSDAMQATMDLPDASVRTPKVH